MNKKLLVQSTSISNNKKLTEWARPIKQAVDNILDI